MKFSKYFIPTRKENPADCVYVSQALMYRAGMLTKVSNGLFVYHPILMKAMDNLKKIVEEELEKVDCVPVKFPILVSKEILDCTGRWDAFGREMFKLKDRNNKEFAISPTNEEAACFMASSYVQSYRDLPYSIYQIQQKHRDEICPRGGVMRAREFIMKDAYSFHTSFEDLDRYYDLMRDAYLKIFKRAGLDVVSVKADAGVMGGNNSQEIMAVAKAGEAEIVICDHCGYAANLETVECDEKYYQQQDCQKQPIETVHTPNMKTISDVVSFFNLSEKNFCKSIIYKTENGYVVAMVRGDKEINEIKLKKYLGVKELELAEKSEAESKINTIIGFVGPVGLKGCKIVADFEVKYMKNFIVGANKQDYHMKNVCPDDFACEYADIRQAVDNDHCPNCGKEIKISMGNELGHIFKLGTRYTEKMNLTYKDNEQKDQIMVMGCYGIGFERTISSIIDQNHDDKGICWPKSIAPFVLDIVTVDINNEAQYNISKEIYDQCLENGIDVIWDERDMRPGFKFNDADLIGFPIRLTVGKKVNDKKVELLNRRTGQMVDISIENAIEEIKKLISVIK